VNPVLWSDTALDRLADLYVTAAPTERDEVVAAAEAVYRELGAESAERGESRGGRVRVTFFGRLTVFFQTPTGATDPVRVLWVHWAAARRR
jgi:hypothetical protein